MVTLFDRKKTGYNDYIYRYKGLSSDAKPITTNGSMFEEMDTGRIYFFNKENNSWIEKGYAAHPSQEDLSKPESLLRVVSLDATELACGTAIESVGTPVYVDDVTDYPTFNLTDTGWYVFARISAKDGMTVNQDTTVTGAAGAIVTNGVAYVDVAVKFDTAAVTKKVTVNWAQDDTEVFIFKSTDLAVRNLDYRVTFYVYDADDFVVWEYALTTDTAFDANKKYYTKNGNVYTLAEVTASNAVPEYYTHSYALTADTTFTEGKTYYTESEGTYTEATVTAGESVTADTYYEDVYTRYLGDAFEDGVDYYTKNGNVYTLAEVTAGNAVPYYYNHSKIIIQGLTRNVTYRLNEIVDCPMEFILPVIEDETHGCWFEIRCQHAGEYSMTLTPPSADVKVATEHTQKETAGINTIDLHYTYVNGIKLWRFLNTHSTIPTETGGENNG